MKGVYSLLIHVKKSLRIDIGKIGTQHFKKGLYVYVGSATGRGPSSIEGRIERHNKKNKKMFWHIDYLFNRNEVRIICAIFSIADTSLECKIVKLAEKYLEIEFPARGFGSSDCRCPAHLLRIKDKNGFDIEKLKTLYKKIGLDSQVIKFQ